MAHSLYTSYCKRETSLPSFKLKLIFKNFSTASTEIHSRYLFDNCKKMATQDAIDLVNKIDKLLVKWYITSTSTDDIEKGIINNKRRKLIYAANVVLCYDVLLWTIAFAAPENSSLHFYFLNGVHALGYLGRLFIGVLIIGHPMCALHSMVLLYYEKRGALTPVSSIKHLFEKLRNPSPQELKKLTFSLKAISYFPLIAHFTGTLCLESIKMVGALLTALSFKSWYFVLAYIPRGILGCLSAVHATQSYVIVHLLITNSVICLALRLDRVFLNLSKVISMSPDRNTVDRLDASRITKENLLDLDSILNEVNDHNRCIKHWLRDELICIGIDVSFIIVFFIEGNNYYEKAIIGFTVSAIIFVLAISFGHAAYLHVKIRSTAKLLHSLQTKTQFQASVLRRQSESMIALEKRNESFTDVVKTKYRILRLIHRVSSPYLRIGFTEGNGESFSPESVASVISTIVTTPLMFLNAKYSSL